MILKQSGEKVQWVREGRGMEEKRWGGREEGRLL